MPVVLHGGQVCPLEVAYVLSVAGPVWWMLAMAWAKRPWRRNRKENE